jgi:GT2 family glycosyltransferase
MSRTKLSVVIVTYNRCRDLEECLNSLFRLNEPPGEVIVVDSNSTDGTDKLVKNYSLKFININERSMVKARNMGFHHAQSEVVAYIDDDVVVCKDWSRYILEPYEDERVGGVVGRVVPYDDERGLYLPVKHKAIGKVFDNGLILGNFDVPTPHPIEVDTLIGCNMAFRRDLLLKAGGFDEKFRGSCFRDDTDLSLRLKRLNYKLIYNPKAMVRHKFRGKIVDNKWFYWTVYNHTYFYLKNFQPMTMWKILTYLFATFFPPTDYVRKTGIRIKLNLPSIAYVGSGLINAILVHRKGDPSRIERILRLS